ncbi:MAG: phosphotransferase [Acetobacterium sp.]
MNDSYGNLTLAGVSHYIKSKDIFPADANLTVVDLHASKESIEGFVNLIYHIYDDNGKSIILKQMLSFPRFRIEEEKNNAECDSDWILDLGRMRSEIAALIFWNAIYPDICPQIYLFDEPNRIIVMEDLMALSLLRFDLCRMIKHPLLSPKIGTFFARNLFFSSNLHLTNYKKEEVERFFTNPEYTALSGPIFEDNIAVSWNRDMNPGTREKRAVLIENPVLQTEIRRLQTKFLAHKECLIHTDLHSSNIMVSPTAIRIIDGEFAGFGPLAQDFGRLTASLSLNFISWFGDDSKTTAEKEAFQSYLCTAIEGLYNTFQTVFRELVAAHQKESYRLKTMNVESYLIEQLQDALSYTGINMTSRLAIRGLCYDISRLPQETQVIPALMGMSIAEELLLNHNRYTGIEQYTQFLKTQGR